MKWYCVSHLSNDALIRDAAAGFRDEHRAAVKCLPHLAEIEARELYVPAGYSSLYQYCVTELGLCPNAGLSRIRAARTAREFPALFDALAEGRLHLSAVLLLAPRLTKENAAELIAAASNQTKSRIEQILAERCPRPDVPTQVRDVTPAPALNQLVPERVDSRVGLAKTTPLAPSRFELRVTIDQETQEDLKQAQGLTRGDVGAVLKAALRAYVAQLEKRKFGATDRPRAPHAAKPGSRHIPAHIRRAVRERDAGRCTFKGDTGHRCDSRGVEFDHIVPVARGGETTVDNLRLLCRAHNQYVAEQVFGAGFMDQKRRKPALPPHVEEVIPYLRKLGIDANRAKQVATLCESIPDASLEDRVRLALRHCGPRNVVRVPAPGPTAETAYDAVAASTRTA